MAILPHSPASDAQPGSPPNNASHNGNNTNTNSNNNNANNNNNGDGDSKSSAPTSSSNGQMKRKPSRRANTAERRATHNAVERQRRETLNGRFLDLAGLLPNLSQIRRPSKSSIVNSSIAHVHASRRHRFVASRELRSLKLEADVLRRELNEWRERAGMSLVDEPARGEGFAMILSGELEVMPTIQDMDDEDDEDGLGPLPVPQGGYGGYVDEMEEDMMVPLVGGFHQHPQQQQPQQQNQNQHQHQHQAAMHPHSHHQMSHYAQQHQQMIQQQQQQHQIHPQAVDEMDETIAALLKGGANGTSNPFAPNLPPSALHSHSGNSAPLPGRPGAGGAGAYDGPVYGPNSGFGVGTTFGGPNPNGFQQGWPSEQQMAMMQAQRALFTPPATSHGGNSPVSVSSHDDPNGAEMLGVNVNVGASPRASVSSRGSPGASGGGSPVSSSPGSAVSPSSAFEAGGGAFYGKGSGSGGNGRGSISPQSQSQGRQRSGSVVSGASSSPPLDVHSLHPSQSQSYHPGSGNNNNNDYVPRYGMQGGIPMNLGGMMGLVGGGMGVGMHGMAGMNPMGVLGMGANGHGHGGVHGHGHGGVHGHGHAGSGIMMMM